MEITTLGNVGWISHGEDVYTYRIGAATSPQDPMLNITPNYNEPVGPVIIRLSDHSILAKGQLNNLPDDIEKTLKENRLIPKLIEKQITMLFGKGPKVYIESFDKDNKLIRKWQKNQVIENWLESWEESGLKSHEDTAMRIIRRFYTFEDLMVKHRMRTSRLLNPEDRSRLGLNVPIVGFELLENKRCRLASNNDLVAFQDDIQEEDFKFVFVGNWTTGMRRKFKKYRLVDASNILKSSVGISHHKNDAVGEIYGINKFYQGVREWIIGANLTPRNINSFIRNSLAAKIHISVPNEWCETKRKMIEDYCDLNANRVADAEEGTTPELIKLKLNDGTYLELGTKFHEGLFQRYFKSEIERCIMFLSGPDNQGKAYTSIKFKDEKGGDIKWEFETLDLKYKEYIESLIKFDERADNVLLSSIGVDGSLTGITKEGVISKSGADVLYNYVIYLHNLTIPEKICMQPFNLALRINFPELYAQGYRIGLYNDIPNRQEDQSKDQRLVNQQQ